MTGTVTHVINGAYPLGAKLIVEYIGPGHAAITVDSPNGDCHLDEDGLLHLGDVLSQMHPGSNEAAQ